MSRLGMIILTLLFLTACQPAAPSPVRVSQAVTLSSGERLNIRVDSGQISVSGGGENGVLVQGRNFAPARIDFSIAQPPGSVDIVAVPARRPLGGFTDPPIVLEIQVPDGIQIVVETFDASVNVRNFKGDLKVTSVSGDLHIERFAGEAALVTGRGDANAQQVTGQLSLLGEHGVLTMQDVHGSIRASSIMGALVYRGRPAQDDEIRLEVDHGPVQVSLAPDTNLVVQVDSTSGLMTCVIPGLERSTRTCKGTIGDGGADLRVRTVSGNVRLEITPLIP